FEPGTSFGSVMARISSEAEVVWRDGHSDYGNALERFWARYGEGVTPRSTVIVTGDARNNYREARPEVLEEVRRASRALYWLNPEPRAYWDTGDSVMGRYTPLCDGAYEVRNLRQLEVFVEEVAVPTRGRVTLGPPSVGS
ncbi:MAG: VWA domain-containing protein, partial [Acidimicrobiia bacterium]